MEESFLTNYSKVIVQFGVGAGLVLLVAKVVVACWVLPIIAYRRIKRNGFDGPSPRFPLGNTHQMKKAVMSMNQSHSPSKTISHDIHSTVFPYFLQWQNSHGKVLVYWLGTEPFLYVADAEFLRKMAEGVLGKSWGKPDVFKHDRKPMFGKGLLMVEGDDWVRHRHVITPAFSPANLKAMASMMTETVTTMADKWDGLIKSGTLEIDVEKEITATAGEIISRTSFGLSHQSGSRVFDKLREMQITLFNSNRYVGVPFSSLLCLRQNLKAQRLGAEIDSLLMNIINARKEAMDRRGRGGGQKEKEKDLLGLLLGANKGDQETRKLTTRELVDECKTFFFGGHETTALALTWTLLLLAEHPRWQEELREEIAKVVGDKEIDFSLLAGLKKMGWVMNEVLRLYSPAPNAQRQAREDIRVDDLLIPKGTNMWIDLISIHHDKALWGDNVNEFHPERFEHDIYGGCKSKMGFLPFGFGGRMCIGRNLTMMEYKVVLTQLLTRFSFSLSPSYRHSPSILLSLRPKHGLPLIVRPLQEKLSLSTSAASRPCSDNSRDHLPTD